ncbi:MAG TPA: response regulator [Nitrosopumilaceae archaeon]|nr:response regulator [Nitrosopumilaceae archaeon]
MASIMIADDSDAIRLVLKDILELGQHTVAGEAVNGQEAIEKFSELKPELLLLDLAMPKKDGFTVVKEIMKTNPDAKIILITAADDQKIINQCLDAGAKAYISKPFEFDNVLKVISKTI